MTGGGSLVDWMAFLRKGRLPAGNSPTSERNRPEYCVGSRSRLSSSKKDSERKRPVHGVGAGGYPVGNSWLRNEDGSTLDLPDGSASPVVRVG